MKITQTALTLLVCIAFAANCFAQGAPASPATPGSPTIPPEKIAPPQKDKPQNLRHVMGTLVSVDPEARALAVRDHEKEMKLAVDSKAVRDQLKQVKLGERVRVDYVEDNGEFVVRSVTRSSL